MSIRRPLLLMLVAALVAAATFALRPDLDLAVARLFYGPEGFVGRAPWAQTLRSAFFAAPFLCLGAAVLAWRPRRGGAVSTRALLGLLASLALGPGLLVNVVLKEHSHRPRPAQVVEFGGAAEFRPFWRFDGACAKNCSFVSGEAASAAWTLAPALLVPAPARAVAVAAALVFTAATAALRMAAGGHFLSDVVFAAFLTLAIVLLGLRLTGPPGAR